MAYAVAAYRRVCAAKQTTDSTEAEKTYRYRQFAEDCVRHEITASQLDYACDEWRAKDTAWVPNFGQLLAIINPSEGYSSAPSHSKYRFYQSRVENALRGDAKPARNEIALYQPPKLKIGMDYDQFMLLPLSEQYAAYTDQINAWDRQRSAGVVPLFPNGERTWQQSDDECFSALRRKAESVRAKLEGAA